MLTPFPFTDLAGQKVRPAVVVSRSDRADSDVMLAFVTSDRGGGLAPGHLVIDGSGDSLAQTGLKHASVVRLDKIVTLDGSLLLGELGRIPEELTGALDECIRFAFGLDEC